MKKFLQSIICQFVLLLSFLVLYSSCQFDINNDTTLPSDIDKLEVQVEDSCIILNWENPTDSEFNEIEISITPSAKGVSKILLNKKTNIYQWQNLTNSIEYTFTVYTIDKKNNKSNGVKIKGTPIDKTPPSEVSNISATTGDSFISLSWTDPSDIDFSSVEICFTPSVNNVQQPILVQKKFGKQNSYKISGLNNGIEYIFTLKTLDNNGNKSKGISFWASSEKPVEETPEEIKDDSSEEIKDETPPADVENLTANIGDSSILLSWTNPSDNDFSHIEITFIPEENNISQPIVKYGTKGNADNKLIQGLQNGIEYTFTIKAVDENGNKTDGKAVKAKPIEPVDETPPAEVTDISVLQGDGSISLSWKNPYDEDFSHIEITFIPEENNISQPIVKYGTKGNSDNKLIQGLQNGIEYTFTIKTVDENGNKTDGKTVKAKPIKPDTTPPAEVSELAAIPKKNQVILSWVNPNDNDFSAIEISVIPSYQDPILIPMENKRNENSSTIIENLENDYEYTFTIRTVDSNNNKSNGVSITSSPKDSPVSIEVILPNDDDESIVITNDLAPVRARILCSEEITKVVYGPGYKSDWFFGQFAVENDPSYREVSLSSDSSVEFNVTENGLYTIAAINDEDSYKCEYFEIKTIDKEPLDNVNNIATECDGAYVYLSWENPTPKDVYDSPLKNIIVSYCFNDDPNNPDNGSMILDVQTQCSISVPSGKTEDDFFRITIQTVDEVGNISTGVQTQVWCCDCIITSYEELGTTIQNMTRSRKVIVLGEYVYNKSAIHNSLTAVNNRTIMVDLDLSQVTGMTKIEKGHFGSEPYNQKTYTQPCIKLQSIKLPDTITIIEDYAFNKCENLLSVNIPASVTSIGKYAFAECNSLTTVSLPYGLESIGNNAFSKCENVTTIVMPNSVQTIDSLAFEGCTNLTNISIPIGLIVLKSSIFSSCQSLESIIIPEGVTEIESGVFNGCTNLSTVIIPDTVTIIGQGAFSGCVSLTNINIPEGVTIIEDSTFYSCTSLNKVTIPASVSIISSYSFYKCNNSLEVNFCDTNSYWYKTYSYSIPEADKISFGRFSKVGTSNTMYLTGYEFDGRKCYFCKYE